MTQEESKALSYARPFVLDKDFERVKNKQYSEASSAIQLRSILFLAVMVVSSLLFFLNGLIRLFEYAETFESSAITGVIVWMLTSVLFIIYGLRYYLRLRKVGRFLASRALEKTSIT
ncbi:MAG: hypothetical protein LAT67_03590 [Balneolales bacterium]|nr:hypothetical protein [Balneolales bacterium]